MVREEWLGEVTACAVRDAGQLLSWGHVLDEVVDAALAAVEPHFPALLRRPAAQRSAVIVGAVDHALDQYGEDDESWAEAVHAAAIAIVDAESECDCHDGVQPGASVGPFDYIEPCGCHRGQGASVYEACARSYTRAVRAAGRGDW